MQKAQRDIPTRHRTGGDRKPEEDGTRGDDRAPWNARCDLRCERSKDILRARRRSFLYLPDIDGPCKTMREQPRRAYRGRRPDWRVGPLSNALMLKAGANLKTPPRIPQGLCAG